MSESLVSGQSDIDEDCVLPDNLSSDDKSQSESDRRLQTQSQTSNVSRNVANPDWRLTWPESALRYLWHLRLA
jgi:hypothetical protein